MLNMADGASVGSIWSGEGAGLGARKSRCEPEGQPCVAAQVFIGGRREQMTRGAPGEVNQRAKKRVMNSSIPNMLARTTWDVVATSRRRWQRGGA